MAFPASRFAAPSVILWPLVAYGEYAEKALSWPLIPRFTPSLGLFFRRNGRTARPGFEQNLVRRAGISPR